MPPYSPIIDKQAGKRLVLVRKHLKLNQDEMAEICQISQGMISMIEKGTREIPWQVLKQLFLKKNISSDYIVSGVLPMEYGKREGSQLMTNIRDLQADIEIMKSHIKLLQREIKQQPPPELHQQLTNL